MKLTTNHQTILEIMAQLESPASIAEIMRHLGIEYNQRSVRRWLSQLAEANLIQKTGEKRATRYQTLGAPRSAFSAHAANVLGKIRQPIFKRTPIEYQENWLEAYQPNQTYYTTAHGRKLMHQAGDSSSAVEPAGTYARHIYNRLLIDLSFNSSRLEGNTYSLLDTKRLLLEGATAEGKLDEEKLMILNHKEAIRYLVDQAHRITICSETVCTLHYLLSDALVIPKYAGAVRDHGVRIGGSTYVPLENQRQIERILARICEKVSATEDPYEQSFFLLVHLSYLQAFTDVNKRTARLSANIPLVCQNLVPISFDEIERDDYISAMIAIYELQETAPLLELYQFSYLLTAKRYQTAVDSLEFDEVRVRYRAERRAVIRHIILEKLTGPELQHFLESEAAAAVLTADCTAFRKTVQEDLKEISPARIAGLGIVREDLDAWQRKKNQ